MSTFITRGGSSLSPSPPSLPLSLSRSLSSLAFSLGPSLSLWQVPEYQVTDIPEGIRQHPYRRDRLPTLEVTCSGSYRNLKPEA